MTEGVISVLRQLRHGEQELDRHLLVVGERHRHDHDVAHVTTALARWSRQNMHALTTLLEQDGATPTHGGRTGGDAGPLTEASEPTAEAIGLRSEHGLVLLGDLRHLFLMASANSTDWTVLGQAARATRDGTLLEVVASCQARTLRQIKWCSASMKLLSPQILTRT